MNAAPERLEDSGGPEEPAAPRLLVHGLSKTFGRQRVLCEVALTMRPGELHGLVGQNGSGKSTLVKILTGIHAADTGARLEVDGTPLGQPVSVAAMRAAGLSVVHQTLGLIEDASVLENVRAGRFRAGRWSRRIDWRAERDAVRAVLERLGSSIDLHAIVATLSAEDRATVAIARALQDHRPGRGLIIFDESTRALTSSSLERFYELVGAVRRAGAAVLLISHRLEEVLHVSDRVSVLRDGTMMASGAPAAELTEAELVKLMIGRELARVQRRTRAILGQTAGLEPTATPERIAAADSESGEHRRPHDLVQVVEVSGKVARSVSFAVAGGEVLGLTGLVGSGFEELPYLLAGAQPARGGALILEGSRIELTGRAFGRRGTRSPDISAFLAAGVALVPERRDQEGLALELSVLENLTLPRVRMRGSAAWAGRGWQEEELRAMVQRLGIRPARGDAPVATLSGGNQQKVLLGKWLANAPRLLLLHEPGQGVDVGAHADIEQAIYETAETGCAVVLASTDAQELAALCQRVLVFRAGGVHAELTGELDPDAIIDATFAGAAVFSGD